MFPAIANLTQSQQSNLRALVKLMRDWDERRAAPFLFRVLTHLAAGSGAALDATLDVDWRALAKAEEGEARMATRRTYTPPPDVLETVERWQRRETGRPLADYQAGLFSQHGEDGITVEVFRRIGVEHRRAVEIGCGANGGNAGILVGALGWDGLLVDGNRDLVEICAGLYPGATTTTAFINRCTVVPLLAAHGFDDRLDYLGIDVDGIDYWIWEVLPVRPRLVVVEFNPLFGPDVPVTIEYRDNFSRKEKDEDGKLRNTKGYFGASIAGLAALGRRKGYRLVCSAPNSSNAYFVREDITGGLPECAPAEAWRPAKGGKGRDQITHGVEAEGVHGYFRARGCPLVDVS
jgi:hypothetical protein